MAGLVPQRPDTTGGNSVEQLNYLAQNVVQKRTQNTTGTTSGFAAGAGTAASSGSTHTGALGSTAYTVGDIVRALKVLGILAQ